MPPALALYSRFRTRAGGYSLGAWVLLALLHALALATLLWSEIDLVPRVAFLLTWALLNFAWLVVLRRPMASAAVSLVLIAILIQLSIFKLSVVAMTATFMDVMVIDTDTMAFLLTIFPELRWRVLLAAAVLVPLFIAVWRLDPFRIRRRTALTAALLSLGGLVAVSLAVPIDREDAFGSSDYVSKFSRSAVVALSELTTHGLMDYDRSASAHSAAVAAAPDECRPARVPPHIILILDESSFDIGPVSGVKVPPGYGSHFRSLDGKTRSFLVEGSGGPTWYTEYNVLTGLSVRSYGRFAEFVTRIAAGRIERSLPRALHNCGYHNFTLYPWLGAFLAARNFQTSIGIDHFLDAKDMHVEDVQSSDSRYYDFAANLIRRERASGPLFVFTYLMANHFPWNFRLRPDLAPDWHDLGNGAVQGHSIDEYLRRQHMSEVDYKAFRARLRKDFPDDAFLIVRFGDHQPLFARSIIDPKLDDDSVSRLIGKADPRFFTTYYAIDAVNFTPADLGSAVDGLDAPYLPLVILEAAGLPLDPAFAEQKRMLRRCQGLFFLCSHGAEARRFNRLLIDIGLIKGL